MGQVGFETRPDDIVLLADDHGGRGRAGIGLLADSKAEPRASFDDFADHATDLDRSLAELDVTRRLMRFREELPGTIAFTTSFGLEDQVILHHISEAGLDIDLVTLDTGRLFPETYATWQRSEQRYGRRVRAIYPQHAAVEALIASQGINGFYASREARASCCHARKVEPLARALVGAQGWITGLRADQSANRRGIAFVAADPERGLLKLAPLADWTRAAVQDFAAAHQVPTNPLHQQGFVSIGCAPCTRAIRPDEPERAGRWWWEDDSRKECGLHSGPQVAVAR